MRRVSLLIGGVTIAGCIHTQSEVDVKPVSINLNITGRLELVITDARQQEETIHGAKPKRTVRPEDIGLPATPPPKSEPGGGATRMDEAPTSSMRLVSYAYAADSGADLVQRMAARHAEVQALLDAHLVGESHTGFLVSKGSLSASQQTVMKAENADRAALYEIESGRRKITADQVALGYYLARLEHVGKGTWVERYDKSTGHWEWFQWDR
jgi:uncharacterized protein YdbL (DUF1318 family)